MDSMSTVFLFYHPAYPSAGFSFGTILQPALVLGLPIIVACSMSLRPIVDIMVNWIHQGDGRLRRVDSQTFPLTVGRIRQNAIPENDTEIIRATKMSDTEETDGRSV